MTTYTHPMTQNVIKEDFFGESVFDVGILNKTPISFISFSS